MYSVPAERPLASTCERTRMANPNPRANRTAKPRFDSIFHGMWLNGGATCGLQHVLTFQRWVVFESFQIVPRYSSFQIVRRYSADEETPPACVPILVSIWHTQVDTHTHKNLRSRVENVENILLFRSPCLYLYDFSLLCNVKCLLKFHHHMECHILETWSNARLKCQISNIPNSKYNLGFILRSRYPSNIAAGQLEAEACIAISSGESLHASRKSCGSNIIWARQRDEALANSLPFLNSMIDNLFSRRHHHLFIMIAMAHLWRLTCW